MKFQLHHPCKKMLRRLFSSAAAVSDSLANATEARLIRIRMVKNQTANGKVASYRAAVTVGNGQGGLGFAIGKDKQVQEAIVKATRAAEKNMDYFEFYENRTIYHDIEAKYKASKVKVESSPPQCGRRVHWAIQEMCRCAGIQDIRGIVRGSRHPVNVCRAFLLALRRQKTPQQVAFDSGMKIEDVLKIFRYGHKATESPLLKR